MLSFLHAPLLSLRSHETNGRHRCGDFAVCWINFLSDRFRALETHSQKKKKKKGIPFSVGKSRRNDFLSLSFVREEGRGKGEGGLTLSKCR